MELAFQNIYVGVDCETFQPYLFSIVLSYHRNHFICKQSHW